ncbi:hypothetical protein EST38_g11219 [Candolleomyces aberdarensis]|uniref:G domain-containing protein n=1 Tax=Candolleomyces aberdarensis TaxID=2316362 RepID=A0A4Q2D5D3_9AGAR|nr:hypothetical protein EST38_g11219 [Candolleomyces aberdarensis]
MLKNSLKKLIKDPQDDVYVKGDEGLDENDIIIPIMGPTGVGKSTHYVVPIKEELAERYKLSGRNLVVVDTPGFNDTNLSDAEILRRIALWLASAYGRNMKVSGVVYMYPIYPNRMTRNDCSNVKVFRKICGDGGLSRVILATTRWDICPPETGTRREEELEKNFWRNLLDQSQAKGTATMKRLPNGAEHAWQIIDTILEKHGHAEVDGIILNIQHQLVTKGKKLQQTDAAIELRRKLQVLLNESSSSSVKTRRENLEKVVQQVKELKIPFSSRIKSFFGFW